LRTQQQILTTNAPTLTTDYLLDLASPLPRVLRETNAGDSTWYLHGMNGVLGAKHGGLWAYFGYDGLGSVRQIYDGFEEGLTGQGVCDLPGGGHVRCLTGALDYDPSGVVTRREGPLASALSLGYTGEMTDASGLVCLRSRYYNPATGTYLMQSMSDGALGRVNAHNGYAYVEGNPANFVSPSGRGMVATGHAVCCWHPVTDPHAFGKALVVFGVAAAITYATMGLGSALAPAILGTAPSALAANVYGAAVIGVSGMAAGQAAIATNNVMYGRDIREGLFRPEDMLRDAALAIAATAFFSGITGVNQFTSWLPRGNISAIRSRNMELVGGGGGAPGETIIKFVPEKDYLRLQEGYLPMHDIHTYATSPEYLVEQSYIGNTPELTNISELAEDLGLPAKRAEYFVAYDKSVWANTPGTSISPLYQDIKEMSWRNLSWDEGVEIYLQDYIITVGKTNEKLSQDYLKGLLGRLP
jgi:RHS repeat-associated protein